MKRGSLFCLCLLGILLLGIGHKAQAQSVTVTTPGEPTAVTTPDEPILALSPPTVPSVPPYRIPIFTVPPPELVWPSRVAVVIVRPPVRPLPPKPLVTEQFVRYGRSVQGRILTAVVLDNGPDAASDVTLIFGGFHGNERTTPVLVRQLRQYLTQKPDAWPGRRVVLVPCANPDGWAMATRVNAHGVDLNRNFPANWSCTGIASRNAPGPAPASEPETRAMIHLLNLCRPQKVVSLHSPLHCLNWTGSLGLKMADAMARYDHYRPTANVGYPTPGSLGDYCGARGIGIVTLELPQESEAASWTANKDALVAAIQTPPR